MPYIGRLVGTRLVSALNRRGRRVDVAKTIYYRRRKGTPAVLEELVGDVAGWEAALVEGFLRLGRARHRLDPFPGPLAGPLSRTPPGGWADLRRPHAAELAGGAFDELHHTPDLRRPRGRDGRYGISRLVFHLYRLPATRLAGVAPRAAAVAGGFTFDPSGRDVPLFAPRGREAGWDAWRRAREWDLPAPIRCRLLGHSEYQVEEALILELAAALPLTAAEADELRALRGLRFAHEARFRRALSELPSGAAWLGLARYLPIAAGALAADCGKAALLPAALEVEEAPGSPVAPERITAGNLAAFAAAAAAKRLVVDPVRGRFLFLGAAPAAGIRVAYHYGFPGPIGAGGHSRPAAESAPADFHHTGGGAIVAAELPNDGVARIDDSATYGPLPNKLAVVDLAFGAADGERPYLELAADWILSTGANEDSRLLLDGLWIGARNPRAVVLRGDYEEVVLRHVTLDPGGPLGRPDLDGVGGGVELPPVILWIEGQVERLVIESSITGPIATAGAGTVERLEIRDSIVQSRDPGVAALALPLTEADLARSTVIGAAELLRLWATETLTTGVVDVTDIQRGCFRFSAAAAGSRLPRPYESHVLDDARPLFVSRRFGDPGFAPAQRGGTRRDPPRRRERLGDRRLERPRQPDQARRPPGQGRGVRPVRAPRRLRPRNLGPEIRGTPWPPTT